MWIQKFMLNLSQFFKRFVAEMVRRKVFRVMAIYAFTAWIILQLAEVVFEPMGYPDWALRTLIISAIVGFPITFILAWVIDIRPEGLIFDLPLFSNDGDVPRQGKKTNLLFSLSLIVTLAAGAYYSVDMLVEESLSNNSIAVLAFENFDGDSETDYFSAGLADEISHVLAGLPELNVSSRTSSFQFRGKQMDIRDVAQRLGVQNVLEGSARQQGNLVRVHAVLVDGESGFNKWGQQYERPLDDIFTIQREIAQNVASELEVVLSIDSIKLLDQQVTQSTDAYVPYLLGLGMLRSSLDADVMRNASSQFQLSVDLDQQFARAYAGICQAHLRLYEINRSLADFELAETACEKSSEIDPGLNAEIWLALGTLYSYRGWFDRAEDQLNKAITLNSEPVDAYIEMSRVRVGQGRKKAAEDLLLKARSMKPQYWATYEALGSFYYRNDRYDEAIIEYEKAITLAPQVATAHAAKGAAYWMLGANDNAIEAYQASLDIKPSRQALTNLGSLYYYAGRFQLSIEHQLKALDFAPNDHRVWGRLADAYFFLPSPEKAREAYARAAELAEENLSVNDKDWHTTALLATYLIHVDKPIAALAASEKAIILSDGNPEAHYFKALVHERNKQTEAAIKALRRALEIDGSYEKIIDEDPFLQGIKSKLNTPDLLKDDSR
jgi:TolB-like protein/tetratricopeptide (TPR) repeat protein